MRKILCILAILLLLVPATALAQGNKNAKAIPTVPVTVPDASLGLLDAAMSDLALAIASGDEAAIDRYLLLAEEKLTRAIGENGDVKLKVKADVEGRRLVVQFKYRPDLKPDGVKLCCGHDKAYATLKVTLKVKQARDGHYKVNLRIKGDLTEQQKAYITALVAKYQGQAPGLEISLKFK
jgi:hypothetical protein